MSTSYTVSEAAERIQVSTSTIRRFADTFSPLLPDYGKQRKGQRRNLSDSDLRHILALVRLMENQPSGVSRGEILQALQDGRTTLVVPATLPSPDQLHEPVSIVPSAEESPPPQPLATVTPAQVTEFTAVLQRVSETLDRIEQGTAYKASTDALERFTATMERMIEAQEAETASRREQTAATERLGNAVHLAFAGIFALCIIVLLTLAVAIGWIG